jgi:hypothetical protein
MNMGNLHKNFTGGGDDRGSKRLCLKGGGRNEKLGRLNHDSWTIESENGDISKVKCAQWQRGQRERGAVAATTKKQRGIEAMIDSVVARGETRW